MPSKDLREAVRQNTSLDSLDIIQQLGWTPQQAENGPSSGVLNARDIYTQHRL